MTIKLTKRAIDALKPETAAIVVYDADLKGFGVRVAASGAFSWFVEYRPGAGGRRVAKRRMVFASRELTPEQARAVAKGLLATVALGKDPAADRQSTRDMPSFREFAERYLSEEAEKKLKPRTVSNYRIYIRKHSVAEIGSRKLDSVSPGDVGRIHRKVGQSTPMTANRVVECISSVYRYAATCGIIAIGHNPTKGIVAFREQRRERFLNTDELTRLGDSLREAETIGIPYNVDETNPNSKHAPAQVNRRTIIDPYAAAAIRILLFTGARLREILHLKWEHIDFERGLLLLPDSKTGRKTIVLNAPALATLADLERVGSFVIAGSQPNNPRADLNRPWRSVVRRAGLVGVRVHDLRHTHASFGAGAGFGLPIIGKLLGHTQAATTQRYAHLDVDPLRRASEAIGGLIAQALAGSSSKSSVGQ